MAFRANEAVSGCTRPSFWSRISVTSGGMGRTYGRAFSQGFPERNGRRQQNAPNTHTWHAVGRPIADDEPSAASFMKDPLAGGNVTTFAAGRDNWRIVTSTLVRSGSSADWTLGISNEDAISRPPRQVESR
jgi:hypothetical protein